MLYTTSVNTLSSGLIFVVDSADRERIQDVKSELFGILTNDAMRGVPVQILANKQDLPSLSYLVL